ncbi:hypothetical protein HMPREF9347_02710 [Escherichia coli MS 124-1]|nr:hypothetical protein HMPREF9536_04246 [Escherichia coli MS 84-1]EFK68284.1 hypothetical protein HMPREF9347_02710 [Escherichia coli MS 124-1]
MHVSYFLLPYTSEFHIRDEQAVFLSPLFGQSGAIFTCESMNVKVATGWVIILIFDSMF